MTYLDLLLVLVAEGDELLLGESVLDGLADPAQVQQREDDAEGQEGQETRRA